jgi:hypothetical protein
LNNKKSAFLRVAEFDNQEFKADVDSKKPRIWRKKSPEFSSKPAVAFMPVGSFIAFTVGDFSVC